MAHARNRKTTKPLITKPLVTVTTARPIPAPMTEQATGATVTNPETGEALPLGPATEADMVTYFGRRPTWDEARYFSYLVTAQGSYRQLANGLLAIPGAGQCRHLAPLFRQARDRLIAREYGYAVVLPFTFTR